MKNVSLMFATLLLSGTSAYAGRPVIRIKCVQGVGVRYGEIVTKDVTVDLNEWVGGEMSGVEAWKGKIAVITSDAHLGTTPVSVSVQPECLENRVTFWGKNKDTFALKTGCDIFDEVGVRRISTLVILNAEKWEKTFQLICERTI